MVLWFLDNLPTFNQNIMLHTCRIHLDNFNETLSEKVNFSDRVSLNLFDHFLDKFQDFSEINQDGGDVTSFKKSVIFQENNIENGEDDDEFEDFGGFEVM